MPGPGNVHRFVVSGLSATRRAMAHWPLRRGLLGAVIHGQNPFVTMIWPPTSALASACQKAIRRWTSFLGVPIVGAGETYGQSLSDRQDWT
jgi:hypothetical protein